MVRTGYEQVVPHRTGKLFCTTAKQDGKVVSLSEDGIVVEYKDGTLEKVHLGREYGKVADIRIPQDLITDLKLGSKVDAGDAIAYNSGFFEKDIHNPGKVILKMGVYIRTVFMENANTLDDSCAISEKAARLLTSPISHPRSIVVGFKDVVHKLVVPGAEVVSDSVLCYIEDEVAARAGVFDEDSISSLRLLSAHSPTSHYKGVVEKIEVYYNGDKEDMSPSLRQLAESYDKALIKKAKSINNTPMTGLTDSSYRVEGEPLALDTMVINIFITEEMPMGVGDKGVFANQLKTVVATVMSHPPVTESGQVIDAVFGARSVFNRIVTSVYKIGTTASILEKIGRRAVSIYRGN